MHILIHLVQKFNSFVGCILVTDFAIILETNVILDVCNLGRVAPAEVHGLPLIDHIQHRRVLRFLSLSAAYWWTLADVSPFRLLLRSHYGLIIQILLIDIAIQCNHIDV